MKRWKFSNTIQKYIDGKLKLSTYQKIGILMLVVVFSGFIGWVWEFGLNEISGGFKHLYIKGGNFLPWINIYAYGALLVMVITYKFRQKPWAVFIISAIACGLLEWLAGWLVYTFGDGTRYWDYTKDWWGFGSINGFVCPLSVTVFGLGSLLLIYGLLPFCIHLAKKMSRREFLILSITLFVLVITDDVTNLTLKNLGLPTAMNFYESIGWVYK
ncbi:putative ABC transporter permease [Candidatus Saccharibacteria bacterium]|nr:putative ABC transporter permease [Candidatus Saccharibacteria bacterium]